MSRPSKIPKASSDHVFSEEELELLDSLWLDQENTVDDVRRHLQRKLGLRFKDEQILAVARRNDFRPTASPAIPVDVAFPPKIVKKVKEPQKCANPVERGSFPAPNGGFSMLGGRL